MSNIIKPNQNKSNQITSNIRFSATFSAIFDEESCVMGDRTIINLHVLLLSLARTTSLQIGWLERLGIFQLTGQKVIVLAEKIKTMMFKVRSFVASTINVIRTMQRTHQK